MTTHDIEIDEKVFIERRSNFEVLFANPFFLWQQY